MAHHRFGDLAADRIDGVERRHRFLKDHRHDRAANAPKRAFVERHDIVASDTDTALHHRALRRQQPHQCTQRHRLARPGFADEAEHFAGHQLQRHAIDRANGFVTADEADMQIVDLDQERRMRRLRRTDHGPRPARLWPEVGSLM